jgi:AAA+ ATPase superfamily predicted ATPase
VLSLVPLEPLFVDRANELAEFGAVLAALAKGQRRHLALLGLRRIGKTLLLDEVRHRHPTSAIVYLALDEIVSSPEDFARAFVTEILRAAARSLGRRLVIGPTGESLREAAVALQPSLGAVIDELVTFLEGSASYGALFAAVMRFPSHVSDALDLPVLIMLDEFQEVTRLRAFPRTDNLLGAIRAALDRRGKVAYAVAGSRISALRNLLSDSESPLFTRFAQLDLLPFNSEGTHELVSQVWSDESLQVDPDVPVRLHKHTGGWPFYTHAVAERAAQLARMADGRITPDTIDVAFSEELIGRLTNVGQNCRYLLETALRADTDGMQNTLEAVLRQVARWQPITRASVERRLQRHHPHARIHRAINNLIDTDFVREASGVLDLADPVFALWLVLEPERRDPEALLRDPRPMRRLLSWYIAQHGMDRQEMGTLFERRVENVIRQFAGQTLPGKLFGIESNLQLPVVRRAGSLRVDDPQGLYGNGPDSYEVDIVTGGDDPGDVWAVEAKHRAGAITRAMVERFLTNVRGIAAAHHLKVSQLWIVAPKGIRADALELARSHGILTSGLRQLEQIERVLAQTI